MGFIQPLDLYQILVNMVSGSIEIFAFLAVISLATLGARFSMSNMTFILMLILFVILVADFISFLYLIIIILVGFIVYGLLNRIFD